MKKTIIKKKKEDGEEKKEGGLFVVVVVVGEGRKDATQTAEYAVSFFFCVCVYACSLSFDLQRSKAKFALVPRLCIKREAQHTQSTLKSLIGKSFFFPTQRTHCLRWLLIVYYLLLLLLLLFC